MKAFTRTYTRNGSYVEDSPIIDLGKSPAASSREPQIISLSVTGVQGISNISLEVVSSQNADLQQGFLQYYTSLDLITDFNTINKKTFSKNNPIVVKNSGTSASEYVYIWIDPQKITTMGAGFVRLKWNFDYVVASSSSSSSSSCAFGSFYEVNPYEEARLLVSQCEVKYFQLDIAPEEYVTIFLNGDPIAIENDGGMLIVNGIVFLDSEYQSVITIGSNQYSVYLIETEPYFVRIYKIGDCSIYDHILLGNNDDLLTTDGFRLLLLAGSTAPGDALILSDGEELYFVDGFRFLLIGRGTDYSSSSSSISGDLSAYAVYCAVNGSYDRANTFVVPRSWFGSKNSPFCLPFAEGWQWDQNFQNGIYVVYTGEECNSSEDCSNVVYTFDWDSIPEPPDSTFWPPPDSGRTNVSSGQIVEVNVNVRTSYRLYLNNEESATVIVNTVSFIMKNDGGILIWDFGGASQHAFTYAGETISSIANGLNFTVTYDGEGSFLWSLTPGTSSSAQSSSGTSSSGQSSGSSVVPPTGQANFVAGGAGSNRIVYSTDGLYWGPSVNGNSIFSGQCYSVCWNGSLFVAAGHGTNVLAYSNNGKDWSASNNGNEIIAEYVGSTPQRYQEARTVCWNGSKFVAGGTGTNVIAYSSDGKTWTAATSANAIFHTYNPDGSIYRPGSVRSICWNGTKFVAGGMDASGSALSISAYSSDGINWIRGEKSHTTDSVFFAAGIHQICSNGSGFVASGYPTDSSPAFLTPRSCLGLSTDGVGFDGPNLPWTQITAYSHVVSTTNTITTTSDLTASVKVGNYIKYKVLGNSLYFKNMVISISGSSITVSGNPFAVGANITELWYTDDEYLNGSLTPFYSVCWNGSKYVAVGDKTAFSSDGVLWTPGEQLGVPGLGDVILSVCWNGSRFIAVGGSSVGTGNRIYYSTDAITWSPSTNGSQLNTGFYTVCSRNSPALFPPTT